MKKPTSQTKHAPVKPLQFQKPFKTMRMFRTPAEVEEKAADLRSRKFEVIVDLKNLKLNYR